MTSTAVSDTTHPDGVLPATRALTFVCPLCRQALEVNPTAYQCPACMRDFPVVHGIPDFRVYPDRFLGSGEDRVRSEKILAVIDSHALPALLEHYWRLSDFTPETLWRRYVATELRSEERHRPLLERCENQGRLLDAGCGTGGLLLAAARRGHANVGTDIALRWLQVARRRFRDAGLDEPPLVCCCADHLPFPDNCFDVVTCTDTLEFAAEPRAILNALARVAKRSGTVLVGTANRYSVLKDPYASLWGVGFLPRRWQAAWVRWRRGAHYENVRLLSFRELRTMARELFRDVKITPSEPPETVRAELPGHYRALFDIYRTVARVRPVAGLLNTVVPHWDATLSDPKHDQA